MKSFHGLFATYINFQIHIIGHILARSASLLRAPNEVLYTIFDLFIFIYSTVISFIYAKSKNDAWFFPILRFYLLLIKNGDLASYNFLN